MIKSIKSLNLTVSAFVLAFAASFGVAHMALADAAPDIQQYNGISYATGGVSNEEQAQFEAMANRYNLRMTMARSDGAYLSDVDVQVVDAQGQTELDVTTAGPFLYAEMPSGTYTIQASLEGQTQEKTVDLNAGSPTELKFTW